MNDVSLNSNSANALRDIQTLLNRMDELPELEPTGGKTEANKPLNIVDGVPSTPQAPLPHQPEIEPAGPGANTEGGLLNVPKAVDKFVNGLPKPASGGRNPVLLGGQNPGPKKPGNLGQPATQMADTMFSLLDVILLIQRSAQERRKTDLESRQANRNLKIQNNVNEANATKAAGEISARYAYISAGIQAGMTTLSAGMQGVAAYKQYQAYSQSGMGSAKANMTAALNDQKLVMESAKPGGPTELKNMNNGQVEIPKGMEETGAIMGEGVPYKEAQGAYNGAKMAVKGAQQKVGEALKNVGDMKKALDTAKAGGKPQDIKTAETNLAKAKETLGAARDNLAEKQNICEEKATAYTEACADFKKAMDTDIKTAEANLKAGKGGVGPGDVENMKAFRESECHQMVSSKDLQSAFNQRIDSCQRQLDVASDRFTNGAAANIARQWEGFAQLAKAVGDVAAAPINAKGGAEDAEQKQKAKLSAAEAERNQGDIDDADVKARQDLEQLNQANELLKFLAESSRATTNRILGA